MLLYKKTKKKRPAFMLVSALLATLILMMIAHGFMLMYGGQFTYLQAAKTASEGQQYAELVGEKVKLEGIDAEEVTSKTNLDTLTGNDKDKDWQYTYEISDGTEDDNGNIFKVATIKIYKDGENSPRYTYEVPLSSLGNNNNFHVPDFNNLIHITSSGFVCPNNGYINVFESAWNYGARVYINNILVPIEWFRYDEAYNRHEWRANIIPVLKGDIITFSGISIIGQNSIYGITFIPCRK